MQIKGIKLKIHPTFLMLLLLCALWGQIARAFLVFALVVFHELAHILAARGYGVKVRSIELYPYGGAAVLEDTFEGKRKDEAVIALAGPAFNFVLLFLVQFLRWEGLLDNTWALELVKINFWLACFNLIPILPLDGGRIVRAFFARSCGFVRTTKFLAAAGKWLGGIFVVLGFFLLAYGSFFYEPGLFIVLGIFFWLGSGKELANARIVFLKQLCRKKEQLLKQGLMPGSSLTVSKSTRLGKIIDEFSADRYCLVSVLGEKDRIEKTLSETEIVQGMLEKGLDWKVGKL
ncbi:MAG: M50 family metallopeptidase [Desulfitobacteriia bacterium]|jgi:stage IV sporulation protein FB